MAMTWFTASIITAIKTDDSVDGIPVFEDFYLIEAESRSLALGLADKIGRDLESLDDGLTLQGKDAKRVFLGIRKLRSVYNEGPGDIDSLPPSCGTELSHSYYEVQSWAQAEQLAAGKRVAIEYVDDANQ